MRRVSICRCYCLIVFALGCAGNLAAQSLWHSWLRPQAAYLSSGRSMGTQVDYPTSCLAFDWNEAQVRWDTMSQNTFAYAPTGGLVERIGSDYSSGSFTLTFRETHQYNQEGFDSLTMGEDWTGSAWEPSFRFLRTFDSLGNVTQSIGNVWNGASWDTSSGYSAQFTYHDTTQIASVIQSSYTLGTGWVPTYKMEYSFDIQDRWDTVTGYVPNQGNWDPDMRLVDIGWHDFSKNQPDSGRFEDFTTTWVDYQRYSVTYSQNDNQVWIYEKFSTDWDPTEQYIFHYDTQGNEILNELYEWIGVWHQAEGLISHRTYNPSNQLTEVWTELFDGYIYRYHEKLVYSNFFVSSPDAQILPFRGTVYPNPAGDYVHFHLPENHSGPVHIAVYDLSGRLRAESHIPQGSEKVTFPVPASLENGAYCYRLYSKQGQFSGRIVVQR